MRNLLEETFEALKNAGRRPVEVLWVGTRTWSCDFAVFSYFADSINYDHGYGTEYIDTSMVVVGEDWWLERGTYDGLEWWNYKTLPVKVTDKKLTSVHQLYDEFVRLDESVCESYTGEHTS